eukprot:1121687-Prorocentrum_minimum.AAC.4
MPMNADDEEKNSSGPWYEQRAPVSQQIGKVSTKKDKCGVCELYFLPENLTGIASWKAVLLKREEAFPCFGLVAFAKVVPTDRAHSYAGTHSILNIFVNSLESCSNAHARIIYVNEHATHNSTFSGRWGLQEATQKLKKWAPTRLYNSVRLCAFCAQLVVPDKEPEIQKVGSNVPKLMNRPHPGHGSLITDDD